MAFQFLTGEANLGTVNLPSGSNSRIPMKFSMDTDGRWIYCNYPERITSDSMFGDSDKGNVWKKKKTISKGEAQIFYSHYNHYKDAIHYGIQIFNPTSDYVQITPLNCGHGQDKTDDSGRIKINAASWTRFFDDKSYSDCNIKAPKSIDANQSLWILDKVIPKGHGFSGNLRFRTSGTVIVTVYAFLDRYKISGAGSQYFYNELDLDKEAPKKYSGYGAGYFLTAAEITIKASDVLNNGGKFFQTCYSEYPRNAMEVNGKLQSDMVPIHIAGTNKIAGPNEPVPRHNVGNWCVQYYIPVRFNNDTNRDVVFKGYIQPGEKNTSENFYILSSGSSNTVYQRVGSTGNRTWHWTNYTVPAHTTSAVQICQFILGTNSSKHVNHIWKVENK